MFVAGGVASYLTSRSDRQPVSPMALESADTEQATPPSTAAVRSPDLERPVEIGQPAEATDPPAEDRPPANNTEPMKPAEPAPAVIAPPPPAGAASAGDVTGLTRLSVLPERVTIVGADRVQQLAITGHFADGTLRDVTGQASLRAGDGKVVKVGDRGLLLPQANGTAEVVAELAGKSVKAPVTVRGMDRDQPINFANDIVPIFGKLGCSTGACHGSSAGQAGFKLSLLGFDPQVDYNSIVHQSRGRRVFPPAPEHSLLLLKPTGAVGHGGGKRLEADSAEYKLLARWIRSGMPVGNRTDPHVVRITLVPEDRVLARRSAQQILVTAHYSDGSHEDVTRRVGYTSNNDELLAVSKTGLVEATEQAGGGSIMARYMDQVAVFRATVPTGNSLDKLPEANNFVDRLVFGRLKTLGIPPSELCTDSEFIRRAALDITGTLPTPAEVEKFLADSAPKKRDRLVSDLLEKPEYGKYFALRWSDILRNKRGNANDPHCLDRAVNFHNWIRDSMQQNKPYDQFVRAILTAVGEPVGPNANPPAAWYTMVYDPSPMVMEKMALLADDTAQVFLGTQINCAQCHHHPYEKWTQDDYWHFAAFFARVDRKPLTPRSQPDTTQIIAVKSFGSVQSHQGVRKTYSIPRPLEGAEVQVPAGQDPRQKLTDWMVSNPLFARALVNRYWGHFMGKGIVDPMDDMRATNPPSNPELLDALAKDFVEHKFDLKHLIRTICTSKSYQLSSLANAHNKNDMQNYSRHVPKRLQAEVLLDAIDQAVGSTTEFPTSAPKFKDGKEAAAAFTKRYKRAIDLPIVEITAPSFLEVFEKPPRNTVTECERPSDATLDQSLYLLNSTEIQQKLAQDGSRAGKLATDSRPEAEKIKELYLFFYSRRPSDQEVRNLESYLSRRRASAQAKRQGYEDILWAMINTKEFLFNH
jgi:hypothetical protein